MILEFERHEHNKLMYNKQLLLSIMYSATCVVMSAQMLLEMALRSYSLLTREFE